MTDTADVRTITVLAGVRDARPARERPCGHRGPWCTHVVQSTPGVPLCCDCGTPRCAHLAAVRAALTEETR